MLYLVYNVESKVSEKMVLVNGQGGLLEAFFFSRYWQMYGERFIFRGLCQKHA